MSAALDLPLTTVEADALADAESTIRTGFDTFVEVGNAFARIRDGRLYRTTHGTFEDYCQQQWSLTRRHVDRMIEASGVVENLRPIGLKIENEAQARELSGLSPEDARDVYEIAKGGAMVERGSDTPTASDLREARKAYLNPTPDPPEAAEEDPGPAYTPGVQECAACHEIHGPDRFTDSDDGLCNRCHLHSCEDEVIDAEIVDEEITPASTSKPAARRRKPLPDQVRDAGMDLRKSAERIERLLADDRMPHNREQVATMLTGHLLYVAETVAAALDVLNHNQQKDIA